MSPSVDSTAFHVGDQFIYTGDGVRWVYRILQRNDAGVQAADGQIAGWTWEPYVPAPFRLPEGL